MLEVVTVLAVLVASSHRATCFARSPGSDASTLYRPLMHSVSKAVTDYLQVIVPGVPVPDQTGTDWLMSYRISKIIVTNCSAPNYRDVWPVPGLRLKLLATNASVSLRSHWWTRTNMIPVDRSGTMNISASGINFNATMTLGRDSRGRGFMELIDCRSTVDYVDLDVQGGDWLVSVADLLLDFETMAKDLIPKAVCETINVTINRVSILFPGRLTELLDATSDGGRAQ